jgi:hypothetical protein
MLRSIWVGLALAWCGVLPVFGQTDAASGASLESYFTGKEVLVKIDMPGSQKGVDLKFNKAVPMDWNDYSSRIKSYGIAIPKGEVARITRLVVKKDTIEFQLNGGGFGSFGDDTNTTVSATSVPKSQYEEDLEKQLSMTTDAKRKRDLQRDLDRERSRRERMNAANQNAAMIASQMKAQQVAQKRLGGGSRFNLRWQGSIPSDSRNPETVMQLLAEYVDFDAAPASRRGPVENSPAPQGPAAGNSEGSSAVSQLKRGMGIDEVSNLLGRGKVVSQSVSQEGLKAQVFEYGTADSVVEVTYVEGVVVRYSINSR